MVITYKVSEITAALEDLDDTTPLESQIKLVAQYMLSQHTEDVDCCLFVCPKNAPEPVRLASNLLNFIVQYYPLIGSTFWTVRDCLNSSFFPSYNYK